MGLLYLYLYLYLIIRTLYNEVSKNVRIRGYFSKPRAIREQKI